MPGLEGSDTTTYGCPCCLKKRGAVISMIATATKPTIVPEMAGR